MKRQSNVVFALGIFLVLYGLYLNLHTLAFKDGSLVGFTSIFGVLVCILGTGMRIVGVLEAKK